jgi:hypothetical protein
MIYLQALKNSATITVDRPAPPLIHIDLLLSYKNPTWLGIKFMYFIIV